MASKGLAFSVQFDTSQVKAQFDAIGSREYARGVQYALDETAKEAKARFLKRIPAALSHGPRAGKPNKLTLDPVYYARGRDYDHVTEISSSIVVKPLQSKWMKYLLGNEQNPRLPGDIGLAADRILIPEAKALLDTLGIRSPGYGKSTGGLSPDAMAKVKAAMAKADAARTPGGHLAAMRKMGRESRARAAFYRGQTSTFSPAKPDYTRVYSGPDRRSGLPTYYVAPGRTRDPIAVGYVTPGRRRANHAGKHLAWTRPDGTEVWLPDTHDHLKGSAPYTTAKVGPKRLFAAIERANYKPRLEQAWQVSAAEAYDMFPAFVSAQIDNRVLRRAEGRRY